MSSKQVIFQYLSAGGHELTVPDGFSNQVLVYAWGAGGGDGYNGPSGGGDTYQRTVTTRSDLYTGYSGSSGTYSYSTRTETATVLTGTTPTPGVNTGLTTYSAWTKTSSGGGGGRAIGGGGGFVQGIITVNSGDTISISVGSAGGRGPRDGRGIGGYGSSPVIVFHGGSSGVAAPYPGNDDQYYGAGGGGGAATAVLVNDIPMIVAAGGGGAGGGTNYQTGTPGYSGNVATLTSATPRGGVSRDGYAVGGGGGGGNPFGGSAGDTLGDDAGAPGGGYGGQNYANVLVASSTLESGSGAAPGGLTNALYPKVNRGYHGNDGAVIVIFTKSFQAWIKDTTWKSVKNAWVKVPDNIITTRVERIGTPVTTTYKTLGTSSWTVPADVNSVQLTYPTITGLVKTTQSVTPGQVISITIGNYGETSAFGGITIPAFEKQVFSYVGNVDHIKNNVVQIATATGAPYTGAGYNATQTTGAAAVGISYTDGSPSEGWHGDLYSTVSITPVKLETMLTNVRVFRSSGSGREIGSHGFVQPAASNSYVMQDIQNDGSGGEGSYSFTTTLQQQGYVRLDFAPVIAPEYIITNTGGWKPISRGWLKEDGVWKSIQSGVSLVPTIPTAARVNINITIAANTNNYVLSDYLSSSSYFPGRSTITLTVNAGVIVGSGSVGSPALVIDGLESGDLINLANYGNIAGAGGQGGAAGSYIVTNTPILNSKGQPVYSTISGGKGRIQATNSTVTSVPGRPGETGGPALFVTYATTLVNNGTIAGGGGGGGGGGGSTGGQGGGGAGSKVGSGANNGTLTSGGAGAGLGGAGGARGTEGSAGTNDTNTGGAGGAPGAAIIGIDNVTISTEGTIIGTRIV